MKIAESSVVLAGEHRLEESRESSESMKVQVSGGWKDFGEVFGDRVKNGGEPVSAAAPTEAVRVRCKQGEKGEPLILQLLLAILDAIKKGKGVEGACMGGARRAQPASHLPSAEQLPEPLQVEVSYQRYERVKEEECTAFSACGTVRTADGREVDFNLALHMDRRYEREEMVAADVRTYQLKDPLVINFNGKAAELTDTRFDFDLNGDGKTESIPFLTAGSGFLALDKDGDGKVSDGRELFGALSGNGFADLAGYDSNRDGWIDDSDPIFGSLLVWGRDQSGQESLESAKKAGVGALFLGEVSTPFALKDEGNRLQGQIRSSGIYLAEDGKVGTLQQVDVAV
jgi:hypothetical protein